MHVTVVVNPLAGGQHPASFDRRAVEGLVGRVAKSTGVTADVHVTDGPGGGVRAARAAMSAGADVIVAWGGDGTVNEVASVIAGTGRALAIVPGGSGNGLARELNVSRDVATALETAFAARTRPVDVAMLGDRAFVNVAGFGFDARVAHRFNGNGEARGFRRYIWFAATEIFRYQPQRYSVRWDGGAFSGSALIIAFANSRQYGNGASIAPHALLDDGALDLVIVKPTAAARDLWRARRLFLGTIQDDPGVECARVREATIESETDLCCHVDGEPISGTSTFEIHVRPRALLVCCG